MPRVSVLMNCYNGERYLREAIDSVMAQTFRDWELIFWDNASSDRSGEIARSYSDARLRYFRGESTVPLGHARQLAMEKTTGEWIGFLDTDDLWYPNKLARQIEAIDGTDCVLCYCATHEISPNGRIIRERQPLYPSGMMFEQQLLQYDITMVSPLIRRRTLEQHRLSFNPEITASEEYNLFLRLIVHGSVHVVRDPLAAMRIAPTTLTDRQMSKWAVERFLTLQQLEEENPGVTERWPRAFKIAWARGEYYRARYLMSQGRHHEARAALRGVRSLDAAYQIMSLLSFVPPLWRLAHSTQLKRKILPRLWWLIAPR